jgi:hypothetical protein
VYPTHASLPVEKLVVTPPSPTLLGEALDRLRPEYLIQEWGPSVAERIRDEQDDLNRRLVWVLR